jgi:glycosyltransferase involved in cell wall biosynthesis
VHGPYQRDQFALRMREVRPAFVGIFSIWAETYAHTLSEAWAAGLPVLVTNLGAPKERVERHGGGWVLDHTDPARAYARILEICGDEDEYQRVRSQPGTAGIRSVAAMADDYDRLYRTTSLNRRTAKRRGSHARGVRRAALFVVQGSRGNHPPTAHVRMLRRLQHPLVREEVATDVVSVEDFLEGRVSEPDIAIVQRNAVPPEAVPSFLSELAARAIPLVVDIDDALFALEPGDESYAEYQSHIAPLEHLVAAADLVTVSTQHLGDALEGRARRVAVVPNMLDEALWFGRRPVRAPTIPRPHWSERLVRSVRSRTAASSRLTPRPRCNLVYIGSRTHADDLAMLRPVLERLLERSAVRFRLFVVGGEPDERREDRWYKRVHVPAGFSRYPAFVTWLRSKCGSWDIAVAPLRDTPFNRCKSDLKFLEYSALGLPGIYSDVVPYSESVRDGETGLLVSNDEEAWCQAMVRLAENADLRARVARSARSLVTGEHCLGHGAGDYVELLRSVSYHE